jgi:putative acetyltransferase
VGHIAFSPVTVDKNETWTGYILAPLGIKPAYQKRQIGSKLVESGMARLTKKGVNAVFVYGDPGYYGKFGFNADAASRYLPPYVLQYPSGWQAIVLKQAGSAALTFKLSCAASLCDPQLW